MNAKTLITTPNSDVIFALRYLKEGARLFPKDGFA
jgi:hypothetical protein